MVQLEHAYRRGEIPSVIAETIWQPVPEASILKLPAFHRQKSDHTIVCLPPGTMYQSDTDNQDTLSVYALKNLDTLVLVQEFTHQFSNSDGVTSVTQVEVRNFTRQHQDGLLNLTTTHDGVVLYFYLARSNAEKQTILHMHREEYKQKGGKLS